MISFTGKNENTLKYREEYVRIRGIREYLLHWPASTDAPVLLHIHGGPGAPATPFAHAVEDCPRNYGIVYYDQRGSGKTLFANPFARLSIGELMQDLTQTVLYVKRVYNKEKIGILGHSWGSVLGSMFALEHPEHVSFYIGCGQMFSFTENERAAYRFLRDAAERGGEQKVKRALAGIGSYPAEKCGSRALLNVTRVRALQGRLGLAIKPDKRTKSILSSSPVWGRSAMACFALGGARSAVLMKEFWNLDLRVAGTEYKMPVYYLMGERDRTTPFELAREYFDAISAPRKKWFFVPNAGHFAMLDNVVAWQGIMRSIAAETAWN